MLSVGDDVLGDSQWIAALYAEMARFESAASLAADKAEIEYRRWKASKAIALRLAKKVTVAEIEESYRADPGYEAIAIAPVRMRAQAAVFQGVKEALSIKSKMLDAGLRNLRGHEQALRVEDNSDRFADMNPVQQEAMTVAVETANRIAAAQPAVVGPPPAPLPKGVTRRARLIEG